MPYQTGTASSHADLLTTLKTFVATNGWSVSTDVIYKGNVFAGMDVEGPATNTYGDALTIGGGLGQSGGALTTPSPDRSTLRNRPEVGDLLNSFPVNYHIFVHTSPDQVAVFINYNSVWWQWLTFGELSKCGSYTGGQFYAAIAPLMPAVTPGLDACITMSAEDAQGCQPCGGLFWSGMETYGVISQEHDGSIIHLELDGLVWYSSGTKADASRGIVQSVGPMAPLLARSNPTWNQIGVLLPQYLWAVRPSSKLSLLGRVAHFRLMRIDNYAPGDIITIGSDKYKVFPWLRKTTETTTSNSSGVWGVAVEYDGP